MAKKTIKRALISSVVAIVLCFAMLVGTTYAWFTDTASAGLNTIVSGKLDMVLETSEDLSTWTPVTSETKLFPEDALFEPGYALVTYVRVTNAGQLWFKYQLEARKVAEEMGINVAGEEFQLSDYLMFGSFETTTAFADRAAAIAAVEATATPLNEPQMNYAATAISDGTQPPVLTLGPGESSDPIALVIYMPTTVGNEANWGAKQPEITFGLVAVATQYTKEEDSFDDQYDADAEYPFFEYAGLKTLTVENNVIDANDGTELKTDLPIDRALVLYATADPATVDADLKGYVCDFAISFNKVVDPADVSVYGQYDAFSPDWFGTTLASANITEIKPDVSVMLIKDWLSQAISGVEVTYNDVLTTVQNFKCALHVNNPEAGLVATVKLVMTDPATGNEYIASEITQTY